MKEVGKSINPTLSNTFASLIKKRLIMLSTKKSRKRNALSYLFLIPVLSLLVVFFSFDLADPVSNFEEFGDKVDKIVEQPILIKNNMDEKNMSIEKEEDNSIQWGNINVVKKENAFLLF